MNWPLAVMLLIFLGAGVLLLIGALVWAYWTLQFSHWATPVDGVIIEANQGRMQRTWKRDAQDRADARGQKVYELKDRSFPAKTTESTWTLTIEFEDWGGNKQQGTTNAGSRKRPYRIGERLPVLYHPDQPSAIRINSFKDKWGAALVIGVLGTAFVAAGLLLASGAITLK